MSLRTALPAVALLCAFSSTFSSAQSSLPPSWTYSSYFGGKQSDSISAQTRDASGNVFVAGVTSSANFPTTPGVYETAFPGPWGDTVLFVSKFASDGSLVWSTYLGPGCYTFSAATGIQADASDNVYVAGIYDCYGFPTTTGLPSYGSVFLTKLNSSGSQILYSTVLGNNSVQGTPSVVLDSQNDAFVSGAGAAGGCCNDATGVIGPLGGIDDFWVAEINSAGTALKWSVEMGGSGDEESYGMAIDTAGKLYVAGYSDSLDFPTTPGTLTAQGGRTFVVKLDPAKKASSSLLYSALIGSNVNDGNAFIQPFSIALDAQRDAYVTNWTYATDLYTSKYAFQPVAPASPSGYVFEVNSDATAMLNGTYIGGGDDDYAVGLGVDDSGNTYVSGSTNSWDFPTTAYGYIVQPFNLNQGFYLKLNPQFAAISSVKFSPGGASASTAVPDLAQGLWVAGYTTSQFFTTQNAFQTQFDGSYDDGFLLHTDFAGTCATTSVAICSLTPDSSSSERIHFTAQSADMEGAASITLLLDGLSAYTTHAAQFDTLLPVAPGPHKATVIARDVNNSTRKTQQSFTVQASSTCPVDPTTPSLTFCSPLNAAAVKGSVSIVVVPNDQPPTSINVYVDNQFTATLQNQNGAYTDTLTLPPGPHTLTAQAVDSNNDVLQTTTVFSVTQ